MDPLQLRIIDDIVLSLVYEVNGLQLGGCEFKGFVKSAAPAEHE